MCYKSWRENKPLTTSIMTSGDGNINHFDPDPRIGTPTPIKKRPQQTSALLTFEESFYIDATLVEGRFWWILTWNFIHTKDHNNKLIALGLTQARLQVIKSLFVGSGSPRLAERSAGTEGTPWNEACDVQICKKRRRNGKDGTIFIIFLVILNPMILRYALEIGHDAILNMLRLANQHHAVGHLPITFWVNIDQTAAQCAPTSNSMWAATVSSDCHKGLTQFGRDSHVTRHACWVASSLGQSTPGGEGFCKKHKKKNCRSWVNLTMDNLSSNVSSEIWNCLRWYRNTYSIATSVVFSVFLWWFILWS